MYEIDLRVGDITLNGIKVEPQEGDFYRIVEVPAPFVEEFEYMDVVELVQAEDGSLDFMRIVVPGGWRRFAAIISLELAESPELAAVLERVDESGGTWARDFGGCLTILLPPGTTSDPMLDIPATGGTQ